MKEAAIEPKVAAQHMVSAANPYASRAGLEILRKGGSAVDAAIAMELVLTLVEPQSSGIGGGAFLLHYDAQSRTVEAYDGRETAPMAIREDIFLNADGSPRPFFDAAVGGQSVGVPGFLRLAELAHREHGRLPWSDLFQPAVRLAETGFLIGRRHHSLVARDPHLKTFRATASYFFDNAGRAFLPGTRQSNPALAATLRAIAEGGSDAFYTGLIAENIAETVQNAGRNPGSLDLDDMASYQAKKRPAICRPYRVWTVCGMPPPTSGGVAVLQILGMLEHFDLTASGPRSPRSWHLIAEASRLAFADRNRYLADSDFVQVPVDGLLDIDYLATRARKIDPEKALDNIEAGVPAGASQQTKAGHTLERPSTTHLVAVDKWGNAVSMTASIENVFGSRLMTGGFLLNNQLTDFSFLPELDGRQVANRIQPGKRPRSSMSPILVLDRDGKLVLATGSPGGPRIIGYVVKSLIAVLDWELDVQASLALPNIVNWNGPTEVEVGAGLTRTSAELEALGHDTNYRRLTSGLHAIYITDAGMEGAADPRREGVVMGD